MPARWPTASRSGSSSTPPAAPRATPGSATAPPAPGSPPRPSSAPARTAGSTCARCGTALYERGCRRVLLEGGPTLAGAFLRDGPGRRGRRLRRAEAARRRPAGAGHGRHRHHRRGDRPGAHRRARGSVRTCASPHCRRDADMFTGIVEELGEVVAARLARRGRGARRARPDGDRRRGARRLDRGQRRLPDRGRRRRRRVHRRRDEGDASTAPRSARCAVGDPVNLERAATAGDPARRPHRAGPRRRGRHDRSPASRGDRWDDVRITLPAGPRPVRGREGLDLRRRHLADRGRGRRRRRSR